MPKFFQSEIAAYDGDKAGFRNVRFKKNDFHNSSAAEIGSALEIIPVHIRNPPVIQFIAYITSLSERYSSATDKEQPFGRSSPYYVWKSNDRSISLSLDIPSSGMASGLDNMNNLSWLLASLYPSYKDSVSATSVAASPLFRVRYSNLISSPTNSGQGLLCVIDNVNVTHDVAKGFINLSPKNLGSSFANASARILTNAGFENQISEGKHFLIPKLIKITMSLKAVHDHPLGWDFHTGEFRGGRSAKGWPYDFGLARDVSDQGAPGASIIDEGGAKSGPPGGVVNQQQNIQESTTFGTGAESEGEGRRP